MTAGSFLGTITVGPSSDRLGPTMAIAGGIFILATVLSFSLGNEAIAIAAIRFAVKADQ